MKSDSLVGMYLNVTIITDNEVLILVVMLILIFTVVCKDIKT